MTGSHRIAHWIVAGRWPCLAAAAVLAALAWLPATRLEFDRSLENMFRRGDPLLAAYRRLREQFGEDEIVMAVYEDPQLLAADGSGIERLAALDRQLREVPGVREVLSLAEVNRALQVVTSLPRLGPSADAPAAIARPDDPLAAAFRDMFAGYTHDARGQIAALACMLEPESTAPCPRRDTIDRLRGILQGRPRGMVAGEPVMVMDGFRYLDRDGRRLGWATMSLLALALFLSFRSLRWVVIAILVVQWTLLLTRASVVWLGLRLSMVSSMLNAIVTVVGVATVVHIIVRFRQARVRGLEPRAALVQTLAILLVPIFWACATDAAGFLSLRVAQVGPVRDFGLMTALSCWWVLCGVMLVVPGLALCGRYDSDPRHTWGDDWLGTELLRMVHGAARRPRGPLVTLVLLFGVSVAGLFRLQIETDFTRNFRRGSPIVESYAFIESRLGGAGVWDVLVPAPAVLDVAFVDRMAAFQEALRAITIDGDAGQRVIGLTKVLSLIDGIQAAGVHPLLAHVPPELRARGMTLTMPHFTAALRTGHGDSAQNYVRVMLRAREQQTAREKAQLIAAVTRVAQEHFPAGADGPGAEVTGSYVLLTNLIDSVLRDQWLCFGVAALSVGLMLAVAFRSIRLALVALVPNVLPILFVLGAMGWLDVKVNMGAAMIAAVSMGLSVDGSIHYIMSFVQARRGGWSVRRAMCEVQHTVGRAVVYATVALIVGFLALCGSEFVPTIYFGCLVSLAMLGGLLGNVLVVPLLLLVAARSPGAGVRDRG
jgi:hypothetical protein